MNIDYVNLKLDKRIFCTSKINGFDYNENVGNFSKHLKANGFTLSSYTHEYYKEILPNRIFKTYN
jgi:hypothetical protein